jgi:TRAP transporter 4TM/12TM fusion protein
MSHEPADSQLELRSEEGVRSGWRRYPGLWGKLVFLLAVGYSLYSFLYIANFFELFGYYLFGAHRVLSFAFLLPLVFLVVPATKRARRDHLPWYDVMLALLSLIPTLYLFILYKQKTVYYFFPEVHEQYLTAIIFALTLEASRRTLGWPITGLGLFFILYTFYGQHFPGFLVHRGFNFERITGQFYLSQEGIFGRAAEVFVGIVVIYVIFAQFLQQSGAGEFFLRLGLAAAGRYRGGPAKAAVAASGLFGTVSGIVVANVMTTGSFTIPLMKRTGYKPHFAGAVETVASTGGALMPPVMGVVAFLMADILEIPYWSIVVAAFIPAVLYYVSVYWQVDFEAARTGLRGLPRSQLPSLIGIIRDGWYHFIPMLVLVYFLAVKGYSASRSGFFAVVALILVNILVGLFLKREALMGPRKYLAALEGAAYNMMLITPAAAVIGIIMSTVSLTGLGLTLSAGLVATAGGSLFLLLVLAALASYILGMGVAMIITYLVLALLVAPAIVQMGVPELAAHLFILYFGVSALITPPVCMAAYTAAAIADSDPFRTGFTAMRLGIVAFIVPFVFVYNPALIMVGSAPEIAFAFVTAILGVTALAAALSGYLIRGINWLERAPLALGGFMLLIPGWTASKTIGLAGINLFTAPGWVTDAAGAALVALPVLWQLMAGRARLTPLPTPIQEPSHPGDDSPTSPTPR